MRSMPTEAAAILASSSSGRDEIIVGAGVGGGVGARKGAGLGVVVIVGAGDGEAVGPGAGSAGGIVDEIRHSNYYYSLQRLVG